MKNEAVDSPGAMQIITDGPTLSHTVSPPPFRMRSPTFPATDLPIADDANAQSGDIMLTLPPDVAGLRFDTALAQRVAASTRAAG